MKPTYRALGLNIYFDDSVPYKQTLPIESDKIGVVMSYQTWKYITGDRKTPFAEKIS